MKSLHHNSHFSLICLRTKQVTTASSSLPNIHLAVGMFDAIHLGHQAIIKHTVATANPSAASAVFTFDQHPLYTIDPTKAPSPLLDNNSNKIRILRNLGVDYLIIFHFNQNNRLWSAATFLTNLYHAFPTISSLHCGEDWRFGHDSKGSPAWIKEQKDIPIAIFSLPLLNQQQTKISSSLIRQAINNGNMQVARQMLGRHYSVSGEVINGDKRGKTLGFATANIITKQQLPPQGVWITRTLWQDKYWHSISNLGTRKTFHQNATSPLLETHIFDFEQDIYGATIEIEFIFFLRPEQKFNQVAELKAQIKQDISVAKQWQLKNPTIS